MRAVEFGIVALTWSLSRRQCVVWTRRKDSSSRRRVAAWLRRCLTTYATDAHSPRLPSYRTLGISLPRHSTSCPRPLRRQDLRQPQLSSNGLPPRNCFTASHPTTITDRLLHQTSTLLANSVQLCSLCNLTATSLSFLDLTRSRELQFDPTVPGLPLKSQPMSVWPS